MYTSSVRSCLTDSGESWPLTVEHDKLQTEVRLTWLDESVRLHCVRDLSQAVRQTVTLGGVADIELRVYSGPRSQRLLGCWKGRTFCCVAEDSEQEMPKRCCWLLFCKYV